MYLIMTKFKVEFVIYCDKSSFNCKKYCFTVPSVVLFKFIPSTLFTFTISESTLFMKCHKVDFDESPDYIQVVFKSAPQRDTIVSRSAATF